MRRMTLLCGVFIGAMAITPLAFGAEIGALPPGNLYNEILRHVRDDALVLPKNPEACAYALYAWEDATESCGDEYAQRFSATGIAFMEEENAAPVIGEMRGTVGIIRFNAFGEETGEHVMQLALVLLERGARELRLDLQDNRGGTSGPDLKILYLFAQEHDRFETRRYRAKIKIYDTASVKAKFRLAYPPGILRNVPVAVWINSESASASELVAGAMKDWGYPVHGTVSYGKGTGQDFFELSDGSFVRLTTFEFFVGNSQTKIHGIGVSPNAPLPDEAREK